MKSLNVVAISLFIVAKLSGLLGAGMSFIDKDISFWSLVIAGALLVASIVVSSVQMSRDKKEQVLEEKEKNEIRHLVARKRELEWQIEELEILKSKISDRRF